jgi:hypothetical protein
VVSTRADRRTGRGGRWLAALGLALLALGAALLVRSWLPGTGSSAGTSLPSFVRAWLPGQAGGDASPTTNLPPFVVAPAVRMERYRPTPSPYAGVPVGLALPALGVRAPIVPVRLSDHELVPPSDPQMLGWWTGSARAGGLRGGTVLIGHTVHTGGGAFDHLDRLDPGDVARVRTARGVVRYVVRAVTTYRKASFATDAARIFDPSVPGRLVLITCSDWNGTTYLSNTVVFADRPLGST